MKRAVTFILPLLLFALGMMGCASQKPYRITDYSNRFIAIDSTIHPDSAMSAWLSAYRDTMEDSLGNKIAYSSGVFKVGKPEGALGDLVADAIRDQTALKLGRYIDLGVFDNSSMRFYLPEGPVTPAEITEIMPYNNHLVLLKIDGSQLMRLAQEIAQMGGQPISGLRMSIRDGQPRDVIVGRRLIEKDSTYLVATSDYIANGGNFQALSHPLMRKDLDLSVRKAIENYIGNRINIHPDLDGRMRSLDE